MSGVALAATEVEPATAREEELIKVTEALSDMSVPSAVLAQAIAELQQLQEDTLRALTAESTAYSEEIMSSLDAVAPTFNQMAVYTEKAKRMAKQMQSIAARVKKLKERASAIQMNAHRQAAKKK